MNQIYVLSILTLVLALGCEKRVQKQVAKQTPSKAPTPASPPNPVPSKPEPQKHERFLWEFKTGGPVASSPAIGPDGTVYVGSYDKKIYSLDGKTGEKKKRPDPATV